LLIAQNCGSKTNPGRVVGSCNSIGGIHSTECGAPYSSESFANLEFN